MRSNHGVWQECLPLLFAYPPNLRWVVWLLAAFHENPRLSLSERVVAWRPILYEFSLVWDFVRHRIWDWGDVWYNFASRKNWELISCLDTPSEDADGRTTLLHRLKGLRKLALNVRGWGKIIMNIHATFRIIQGNLQNISHFRINAGVWIFLGKMKNGIPLFSLLQKKTF